MLKTQTDLKSFSFTEVIHHFIALSYLATIGTLFSVVLVEKISTLILFIAIQGNKMICSIFSYATLALEHFPFVFNNFMHFNGVGVIVQNRVTKPSTFKI